MGVIGLEVRTECPKCAAPLLVGALTPRATCLGCLHDVDVMPTLQFLSEGGFWEKAVTELEKRRKAVDPSSALQAEELQQIFSGEGGRPDRQTVTYDAPVCAACGTAVPLERVPAAAAMGTLACPKCAAPIVVRPAPRHAFPGLPGFVSFLVGEDPGQVPGSARAAAARPDSAAPSPVRFPCPSCGASLTVDGAARTVDCSYCHASAYLPDDLWRRLHPARTVVRWHVLFDEVAAREYRRGQTWFAFLAFAAAMQGFFGLAFVITLFVEGVEGWPSWTPWAAAGLWALLLAATAWALKRSGARGRSRLHGATGS